MASEIWIFGYGSLIWNPGFEHTQTFIGEIKGYSRKFYQGSDVHRGNPQKLGRVVTLMEDKEGTTWGQAIRPKDAEEALEYLTDRESSLGGYETIFTQFYPRDPQIKPFMILVYIALPNNSLFRGPETVPTIARDIAASEGQCGHNVEYLAKLAAFMRIELPHIVDEHLYSVESHVRQFLDELQHSHIAQLFTDAVDSWLARSANYVPTFATSNAENSLLIASNCDDCSIDDRDNIRFIDQMTTNKLRCIHKF